MLEKARANHWLILVLLALAQFMVVLDTSIVNVALPALQEALKLSATNLQWVVTAYTLAFGGFLLLGGRAADLYGRRKVFLFGLGLFTVSSLAVGLAQNSSSLIALRGLQGLAGAFMSPAALSIVLITYKEGHERNIALAIWGAVASGGAAAGVLLGGILTQYLDWRWNFFVNVPVGLLVMLAAWKLLPKHESEEKHNDLDLPGALTVTGGLMLLVYGLVKAPELGWTDAATLWALGGAVALLAAFVVNELRAKHPLVPFSIFKIRNVTGANLTQLPITAAMFAVFFFTSIYIQNILGYSPLKTGVSFLIVPLVIGLTASNAPRLVKAIGFKKILMVTPLIIALGLYILSHVPAEGGSYVKDVMPGLVVMGIGMGFSFVSITIAATSGVPGNKAGLASGLLNTSQQIGGALGLAILSGVAASATTSYMVGNHDATQTAALVHGFETAFRWASGFGVAAAVLAALVIKEQKNAKVDPAATAGMH
jgi:EmrB/QacA subfamily drug resistance transporter